MDLTSLLPPVRLFCSGLHRPCHLCCHSCRQLQLQRLHRCFVRCGHCQQRPHHHNSCCHSSCYHCSCRYCIHHLRLHCHNRHLPPKHHEPDRRSAHCQQWPLVALTLPWSRALSSDPDVFCAENAAQKVATIIVSSIASYAIWQNQCNLFTFLCMNVNYACLLYVCRMNVKIFLRFKKPINHLNSINIALTTAAKIYHTLACRCTIKSDMLTLNNKRSFFNIIILYVPEFFYMRSIA